MLAHSLGYLAIRAVNGVLALVTLATLTRLLSPSDYGRYALALAGINVTASVLFQWLNAGTLRLHAVHAEEPSAFLHEVRRLYLTAATLGALILAAWLIVNPMPSIDRSLAFAIGLGGIAMGAYSLNLQLMAAQMRPGHYGAMSMIRAGSTLALGAGLILAGAGVNAAVFAIAGGAWLSVTLFGQRWSALRHTARMPDLRRQIITYGMPLALTYAGTMIIDATDRFLIGWWYGPAAVGGYAAGYDLVQQTIGVVMNVFFLAAYPRITGAWERGGVAQAREAMQPLATALLWAAPLCAGLFIGLSEEIANLAFGHRLSADAARIMPWIAAAITIGSVRAFFLDIAFQLQKRTRSLMGIILTMAVVNVAANFLLLPRFGPVGSAYAAVIAFTTGAVGSYVASRRLGLLPIGWIEAVKAVACASALIGVLRYGPSLTGADALPKWVGVGLNVTIGALIFVALALGLDLGSARMSVRRAISASARRHRST